MQWMSLIKHSKENRAGYPRWIWDDGDCMQSPTNPSSQRKLCINNLTGFDFLFGNVRLNLIISTSKKVPCLIHFWSPLAPLDLDTLFHQISILLTANCVMDVLDFFESTNKAPMASVSAFGFRFQSSVNPPRKRIVILPDPFLLKKMENIV